MRTQEEAIDRLGLLLPRFYESVARAKDEYRKPEHGRLLSLFSRRSHSSNLNDLIWDQLKREFDEESGVVIKPRSGSFIMLVGDEYRMRVKKLNRKLQPQNNPTQTVLEFLCQFRQLTLLEEPTSVDLGYRLVGPTESTLEVWLRCPKDEEVPAWMILIEPSAGAAIVDAATAIGPTPPSLRLRSKEDEEHAKDREDRGGSPS